MEMHQVRYFLAAAKTLSFTRTAEVCHVSQPALTTAIKKLEAQLGSPLFHREGRQVALTDLFGRLKRAARNVIRARGETVTDIEMMTAESGEAAMALWVIPAEKTGIMELH